MENMILAQLVEDLVPGIKRYRKQILVFHNSSGLLSNCLKILRKYGRKKGYQPTRRDMDDKNLSTISSGAYLRKIREMVICIRTICFIY